MNQPHIVVSRDNHQVGSFPIEKDALLIGRKADNDICLNSLSVSGHHSKIISVIDSFFLEDLGSTNGTYVNTRPIKKYVLQNGDVIQIGNHRLEFIAPDAASDDETNPATVEEDVLEQTIILTADELHQNIEETQNSEQAHQSNASSHADTSEFLPQSPITETIGKLQILNGKHAGVVLELVKSLTTFGAPGSSIAGVTRRGDHYYLIRVQGTEETVRLNGEGTTVRAKLLEEHDIIEVANTKLEFYLD